MDFLTLCQVTVVCSSELLRFGIRSHNIYHFVCLENSRSKVRTPPEPPMSHKKLF